MRNFQLTPFVLRQPTYLTSGQDVITLDALPDTQLGRIAHLAGFQLDVKVTPTFTTAPTVYGLNNVVKRLEFNDGSVPRFQGSFNILRVFEIMERGKLAIPDPDTNSGSTNAFYYTRFLPIGPPNYQGAPTDFLLPCSALKTGKLEFTFGSLTDISNDTTAVTVTIKVTAWLAYLDGEVRIPSFYERNTFQVSNADALLPGRALYSHLSLLHSQTLGAIASGDYASIIVGTGSGDLPSMDTRTLTNAFWAQMDCGQINELQGEPAAATDDNSKIVNRGTPTALVSADAYIQPVAWAARDMRISKLALMAESGLRVRWPTGSNASAVIAYGRFTSLPATAQAALLGKVTGELGMTQGMAGVATLSKGTYKGPRDEFMPHYAKVS